MIVLLTLAGALVGSFLNVCIDRLPARESVVTPPSHCPACKRRLSPVELIPVVSYLALRGRCRSCGAAIPRRVLVVEILTALLFGWLGLTMGAASGLAVGIFYTCVLTVIFFIDLEHRLVLNRVTFPAMAIALLLAGARTLPGDPMALGDAVPTLLRSLAGGAVGFVVLFLPAWLTRGGIGLGDVKLGALMGLALGLPAVLAGLFLGFLAGGVGAIVLLATGLRGRRDAVPYAPFLATGAWLALLYGNQIMAWYLARF